MAKEIPVYLFVGFLESGKTKFIQETFEDPNFDSGDKTLLLVCEEGEEEYDPYVLKRSKTIVETIEEEADFTPEKMVELEKKYHPERIIIEYNGMWQLQRLYEQMPQGWMIYQEVMIADYNTFLSYNTNMRSLMVDKLTSCEMVLLNRAPVGADKMEIHKVVRGVSRRTEIGYDYVDGNFDYDEIEDPLPFDIEAPIIEIADADFAVWYRDLTEEMEKYQGKTVRFKGRVVTKHRSLKNCFVCGRHVMTCCVEDITYSCVVAEWEKANMLQTRQWVQVTGKIHVQRHKLYRGKGPVLQVQEVVMTSAPEQEVATFY